MAKRLNLAFLQLEEEWGESELGEYPHFMIKEIHEQLSLCIVFPVDYVMPGTPEWVVCRYNLRNSHNYSRPFDWMGACLVCCSDWSN